MARFLTCIGFGLLVLMIIIPIGSVLAQSEKTAFLEGKVSMYDPQFNEGRLYERTDLMILPADSIPYDLFDGDAPSQHSVVVNAKEVNRIKAGYVKIYPSSMGRYRFSDLLPSDYWVCSVDAEIEEDMAGLTENLNHSYDELNPLDEPVFIWGCQYITLKPGKNTQNFYWNGQGFWIDE